MSEIQNIKVELNVDSNNLYVKLNREDYNALNSNGADINNGAWLALDEFYAIIAIPLSSIGSGIVKNLEKLPQMTSNGVSILVTLTATGISIERWFNNEVSTEELIKQNAINWTAFGIGYAVSSSVIGAVLGGFAIGIIAWLINKNVNWNDIINSYINEQYYQNLFDQGYWGAQYARYKTCEATAVAPPRRDPLVLDLDKDGDISPSRYAYFDYDGDGTRELGSWFSSNDGLLAIDKNGDGTINDGSELFGDAFVKENGTKASNGMDALRDIDSNDDGVIDALDERFSQLRIWKDADGDGTSQAEEIHTLEELGVVLLGASSEAVNQTDAFGNTQINAGTFAFSDGTEGAMGDWSLQINHMATKYDYTLTAEQKAA